MSLGGVHYNEKSTFANKKSVDEYVDSAIAKIFSILLNAISTADIFARFMIYTRKANLQARLTELSKTLTIVSL